VNGASDVKVAAVNSLHGQGVFCQPGWCHTEGFPTWMLYEEYPGYHGNQDRQRTRVNVATNVALGFTTQKLSHNLHLTHRSFLFDLNQNWNVWSTLTKNTLQLLHYGFALSEARFFEIQMQLDWAGQLCIR
jgi:hypothetical protein